MKFGLIKFNLKFDFIMKPNELRGKVNQSKGIVLYFKNDHCPPCIALRPKVENLITRHFPKMDFEIVDTVLNPQLSNEFKVFANPTILIFFEGKEYIRKSKYISIQSLKNDIERLYEMAY